MITKTKAELDGLFASDPQALKKHILDGYAEIAALDLTSNPDLNVQKGVQDSIATRAKTETELDAMINPATADQAGIVAEAERVQIAYSRIDLDLNQKVEDARDDFLGIKAKTKGSKKELDDAQQEMADDLGDNAKISVMRPEEKIAKLAEIKADKESFELGAGKGQKEQSNDWRTRWLKRLGLFAGGAVAVTVTDALMHDKTPFWVGIGKNHDISATAQNCPSAEEILKSEGYIKGQSGLYYNPEIQEELARYHDDGTPYLDANGNQMYAVYPKGTDTNHDGNHFDHDEVINCQDKPEVTPIEPVNPVVVPPVVTPTPPVDVPTPTPKPPIDIPTPKPPKPKPPVPDPEKPDPKPPKPDPEKPDHGHHHDDDHHHHDDDHHHHHDDDHHHHDDDHHHHHVPGKTVQEPDTVIPGKTVQGPDTVIPGQTVQGPDTVIPGQTVQGPDTVIPGQTVQGPDTVIPGQTIQGPDVHLPGQTIQDPDVHIPGQTIQDPAPTPNPDPTDSLDGPDKGDPGTPPVVNPETVPQEPVNPPVTPDPETPVAPPVEPETVPGKEGTDSLGGNDKGDIPVATPETVPQEPVAPPVAPDPETPVAPPVEPETVPGKEGTDSLGGNDKGDVPVVAPETPAPVNPETVPNPDPTDSLGGNDKGDVPVVAPEGQAPVEPGVIDQPAPVTPETVPDNNPTDSLGGNDKGDIPVVAPETPAPVQSETVPGNNPTDSLGGSDKGDIPVTAPETPAPVQPETVPGNNPTDALGGNDKGDVPVVATAGTASIQEQLAAIKESDIQAATKDIDAQQQADLAKTVAETTKVINNI